MQSHNNPDKKKSEASGRFFAAQEQLDYAAMRLAAFTPLKPGGIPGPASGFGLLPGLFYWPIKAYNRSEKEGGYMRKFFSHKNVSWCIRILCIICLLFGGSALVLICAGFSLPAKTGSAFLLLTSLLFFIVALDKNLFALEKVFSVLVGLFLLWIVFWFD